MKLGAELPGLAWWHPDRWYYGLLAINVQRNEKGVRDWFHWTFGLRCDFNFARGMDFDELSLLILNIGPFVVRLLFIIDRGGGIHDNGD